MTISSLSRYLLPSIRTPTPPIPLISSLRITTTTASSSSAAEKYYAHLLKHPQNPEKTLSTVKAELDASSVAEVCLRCSSNHLHLGLRFFIWAGFQSGYRHSRFMYGKACKLFEIDRNPCRVREVFEAYRADGFVVNVKVVKVVLNLCREAGDADQALWVLRMMGEFQCRMDNVAYNVVIRLLGAKGDVDMAMGLVREMVLLDLHPDMVTYVEMIKALCDAGRLDDACNLIKDMKDHGCTPHAVVYSSLLHGVCRFGSSERMLELLGEMEKEGGSCSPNVVTYTSVIQGFCEKGRPIEALRILDRMGTVGCAPNHVTVSVLVKELCSAGYVSEAYKVVDKVVAGGSASKSDCYSSLMLALLRSRQIDDAEKLFMNMLTNEMKPSGLACSSLIRCICLEGRVLGGFHYFQEVVKMGILSSIEPNVYSVLIVGLCQQNYLIEVAELANLMLEQRIQIKAAYFHDMAEKLKGTPELELLSGAHLKKWCVMQLKIKAAAVDERDDDQQPETGDWRRRLEAASIDAKGFLQFPLLDSHLSIADEGAAKSNSLSRQRPTASHRRNQLADLS
ncbi:hypothetical protein Dimus_000666 [Dionaea muscipula]